LQYSRRSRPFAVSQEQAPGTALYKCQPHPLAGLPALSKVYANDFADNYHQVELQAVARNFASAHVLPDVATPRPRKGAGFAFFVKGAYET
jgi:hypothetical protein